jgi:hypothetical protein
VIPRCLHLIVALARQFDQPLEMLPIFSYLDAGNTSYQIPFALAISVIDRSVYSVVVSMAVATTVIPLPFLKLAYSGAKGRPKPGVFRSLHDKYPRLAVGKQLPYDKHAYSSDDLQAIQQQRGR